MQMSTHNELKIKKKLAPKDYNLDDNVEIIRADGSRVVIPVILIHALRSGELKLVDDD